MKLRTSFHDADFVARPAMSALIVKAVFTLLGLGFFYTTATPTFATSIVVLATPDQIIVAGDSLSVSGSSRDYSTCKIIRVGNLFFASSGIGTDTAFDIRKIARESGQGPTDLETLRRFEAAYFPAFISEMDFLIKTDPDTYRRQVLENGASAILFFGFESGHSFFHARAYNHDLYPPSSVSVKSAFDCPGSNCPTFRGTRISHVFLGRADAITHYLDIHPPRSERSLALLATKLVQLEISDVPTEVGRPVDVLRVTKKGGCWIKHKKKCGNDIPFCKQ